MVNETAVTEVVSSVQSYFYTIVVGVVILLVGLAAGILVKKVLSRILKEIGLNKIITKARMSWDGEGGVSSIVSYAVYIFTIILFLEQLGIRLLVLYIVVIVLALFLILTFFVGLKDILPNFRGWIYIHKRPEVQVGKKIKTNSIIGTVQKVGYLETKVKTAAGDVLYIPNALFLKKHQ